MKIDDKIEMCLKNPGYETDVFVQAEIMDFVQAWRGIKSMQALINNKQIRLTGHPDAIKSFPDWFLLSSFAQYKRLKRGLEYH